MGGGEEVSFPMNVTPPPVFKSLSSAPGPDHKPELENEEVQALQLFLAKLESALGATHDEAEAATEKLPETKSSLASSADVKLLTETAAEAGDNFVFIKENVAVHPGPEKLMRQVAGCLCLAKRDATLLMSWLPYPMADSTEEEDTFLHQQGNLFKDIAVPDFHSVRRFSPPLGCHYIIIVLKSGLALPPLYFHSGGIKSFLSAIRLYATLSRVRGKKDVYLVNFLEDPLERTLSHLGLPGHMASGSLGRIRKHDKWGSTQEPSSDRLKPASALPSPSDVAFGVLEKLSMVTRFARDTTTQIVSSLLEEESPREARQRAGSFNERATGGRVFKTPGWASVPGRAVREELKRWDAGARAGRLAPEGKLPTTAIAVKLAPISAQEFSSLMDSEGRLVHPADIREAIFRRGIDASIRSQVWKLALGVLPFSSTAEERSALEQKMTAEYRTLRNNWMMVSAEEASKIEGFADQIFAVEKDVTRTEPTLEFYAGDENPNVKILRSILVTYSFYNADLGYCQGMCDLLAPILFTLRDEAQSFWCFNALMKRAGANFHQNQVGMQVQIMAVGKLVQLLDPELHSYFEDEDCLNYFFCFRWIFLLFKREFPFDDILVLFDKLFVGFPTRFFHLFMCVAILRMHKEQIMGEQMDFETLLKYINDLSGKVDLREAIRVAEELYKETCRLLGSNLE